MLTFNLKKEWFEKIKSGEKTHEYREVKPYWTKRFMKLLALDEEWELNNYKARNLSMIIFVNGYNPANGRLGARLYSIKKINGLYTDLKIDKPVYDIEFELIESEEGWK